MQKHLTTLTEKWWLPCLLLFIAACQNEADKTIEKAPNKFYDQTLIKIYEHQDRRDTDSLLQFFNDENPAYRAAAAEAFGSVQDSLAIPMLTVLLSDNHSKVRKAAAYALGQTYDSAAIQPLSMALDTEDSLFVRRELFEALGKVITLPKLSWLNMRAAEAPEEKAGLAWGLYRSGIRNVYDNLSLGTAIALLSRENNYDTRLGAAHFLARAPNLDLRPYLPQLIEAVTLDSAANVRMAIAIALGTINSPSAIETLADQCLEDRDYRVRINALRALSGAPFEPIKDLVYQSLEDKNDNVAITAAQTISGNDINAAYIAEQALKQENTRVKAILLGAALKASDNRKSMSNQIKLEFENASDPYYKAGLLTALGHEIANYEFIITKIFEAEKPVVATAGANALVSMRRNPSFPDELKPAFADIFKELVATADVAVVAIVAGELSNPENNFAEIYKNDTQFLHKAKEMLSLPKDNEALQPLNKAIALFEGKETIPETKNDFNHPIDWELVKTIPNGKKVKVKTAKGVITLKLLVEEAPGSVANFYNLAKSGYFDNKNFHRVVPNFVIQGGCNRGDGYGGEDYSIRSEFANLRYQTGSVGMASAGKDTEGTQWFVTHSPTPHLDGRYTIFARVTDGMEVVNAIGEGDIIKSVIIEGGL